MKRGGWVAGILCLLYAGLASAQTTAQASRIVGEPAFPVQVSLSHLFPVLSPIQFGGTCHAYSSVALMEAACFAVTGQRIGISRGYLVDRHFLEKLHRLGPQPLLQKSEDKLLLNFAYDSGDTFMHLQRICGGDVCTAAEFPTQTSPWIEARSLRSGPIDAGNLQSVYSRIKATFEDDIRSRQLEVVTTATGPTLRTRDPLLKSCVSQLEPKTETNPPLSEIRELIRNGTPVLCDARVDWANGGQGKHSVIITGFRFNPRFDKGIEYQVLDSYSTTTPAWSWRVGGCDRIVWLQKKEIHE
jgi:hypothetical protein